MTTDPWRAVFREHLCPRLRTSSLEALAIEIDMGGPRLVHRVFTDPPPLHACRELPCAAGCLLGFLAMLEGARTVEEVYDWIHALRLAIESWRLAILMNLWDGREHDPRPDDAGARLAVLEETRAELERRAAA